MRAIDVRDFGYISAASVNLAIDAAVAEGGGVVDLAVRLVEYDTPIILKSGVTLRGQGPLAGKLQAAPGANCDAIKSEGFDALVGTGSLGGVSSCGIEGIYIDARKDVNAGRGVCLYGHSWKMKDVRVSNASGDGIVTEWGNWGTPEPQRSMEAEMLNTRVNDCDGRGYFINGPHDMRVIGAMATCNLGTNIHAGPRAGGAKFIGCHGWSYGLPQQSPARQSAVCWLLDSAVSLTACHGEGATDVQCWLRANDIEINGGWFFRMSQTGDPAYDNNCLAFRIGETNGAWIGSYSIRSKVFNTLKGIVEHTNRDGGNGDIDILSYMWGTPTQLVIGNHPATTAVKIHNRGASPAFYERLPGDLSVGGALKFGTYTAQAGMTQAGYVTITDQSGAQRKIAVVQ